MSVRTMIDEVVFSPVSNAVHEYESDSGDEIWFAIMSIDDLGNDYGDLMSLIPHIYANSND